MEEYQMKAYVNQETCISCGLCEGVCPEVFELNEEGKSVPILDEIPDEFLSSAQDAESGCPVDAIVVE